MWCQTENLAGILNVTSICFRQQAIQPGKILCVGKNYRAHIEEMHSVVPDHMVVFMKPGNAIGNELYAELDETLHYEAEICLLIDNDKVAGVGFGLDLTKRGLQAKLKDAGLPWERAKAFDGAALFSDFVEAPEDLSGLSVELRVNGELRQQGGVPLMLYPPTTILEELRGFTRLCDGDVIMTGTPAGVGPVRAGDHFEGRILNGEHVLVAASWMAR